MTDETTILIRDLIAAGVDASLIVRVTVLCVRATDLDRRRKVDADRQQRRRSKRQGHVTDTVRHGLSRDAPDPLKVPPTPPLNNPTCSKPKRVSHTARAWPDGWEPDRDFARRQGWSEERIDSEIARFHDRALAKHATYSDWPAAWRNWCRSPYQKGAANGSRPRTLADAADDLIARAENFERESGPIIDHEPC